MKQLIDISNDMTPAFYKDPEIKKGKVLIFNFEGSETHLKIVRLNRKSRTCLAEEVRLHREEEVSEETLKDIQEQINGRD